MNLVKFFEQFDKQFEKKVDSSARATELDSSVDSSTFSTSSWSVLCFTGKVYPLLFFSRLFFSDFTRELFDSNIVSVNLEAQPLETFLGQLQMSFLGQNNTYWCKNTSVLDSAQRKKFLAFVQSYQGPHEIIFFTSDSVDFSQNAGALTVSLEEALDSTLYQFLYTKLYGDEGEQSDRGGDRTGFARALFVKNKNVTLDHACLMMDYNAAVGDRDREVCGQWLDRLIVPDMSLFTLSQYFFARESTKFMRLWHSLEKSFPLEFWLSFWSEQLWQATVFLSVLSEYGPVAARKQVKRLPFSFMQKDYRRITKRELTVAHNFLYSVDYGFKNGYASSGLELFFLKFLHGQFARK